MKNNEDLDILNKLRINLNKYSKKLESIYLSNYYNSDFDNEISLIENSMVFCLKSAIDIRVKPDHSDNLNYVDYLLKKKIIELEDKFAKLIEIYEQVYNDKKNH